MENTSLDTYLIRIMPALYLQVSKNFLKYQGYYEVMYNSVQ